MGLSGGGKSYLVSDLIKHGKFLSEDVTRLTFKENKPFIHPSHCLMKLDSVNEVNNIYFSRNSILSSDKRNRSSYSVKDKFLSKKSIKLGACFFLNFSDHFSINELNERQSFAVLLQSSFKSKPLFSSKEYDISTDDRSSNTRCA